MKLLLTFISIICLSIGLIAKPEKKGKGDKPGRPSREEMMKKFDKDGDGKLSDEEKAGIRKAMANRTPPAHILEKFDKDGDGKLNPEERRAAMAARPKPGEGKKPEGKGKKKEGKGKLTFADGSYYEGEFKQNEICGYGKYYWPDGKQYDG